MLVLQSQAWQSAMGWHCMLSQEICHGKGGNMVITGDMLMTALITAILVVILEAVVSLLFGRMWPPR